MAVPIVNTDVDLECLSLLEEWMFECTDKAGIAGDEQWGLDAGHHQDCWVPYEGTPSLGRRIVMMPRMKLFIM
ncbi:hypothetical protein B0H17DRAFT_951526 [Mycena rosella]|uniref:Uncharacterized protein n=1 Tax=Mycena rosella TaxID=1033263 RepID=A0AAD7CVP9_MYCRO|nr:hypothetical protein B0H17DRAFT_951526 [Mycena rosella]